MISYGSVRVPSETPVVTSGPGYEEKFYPWEEQPISELKEEDPYLTVSRTPSGEFMIGADYEAYYQDWRGEGIEAEFKDLMARIAGGAFNLDFAYAFYTGDTEAQKQIIQQYAYESAQRKKSGDFIGHLLASPATIPSITMGISFGIGTPIGLSSKIFSTGASKLVSTGVGYVGASVMGYSLYESVAKGGLVALEKNLKTLAVTLPFAVYGFQRGYAFGQKLPEYASQAYVGLYKHTPYPVKVVGHKLLVGAKDLQFRFAQLTGRGLYKPGTVTEPYPHYEPGRWREPFDQYGPVKERLGEVAITRLVKTDLGYKMEYTQHGYLEQHLYKEWELVPSTRRLLEYRGEGYRFQPDIPGSYPIGPRGEFRFVSEGEAYDFFFGKATDRTGVATKLYSESKVRLISDPTLTKEISHGRTMDLLFKDTMYSEKMKAVFEGKPVRPVHSRAWTYIGKPIYGPAPWEYYKEPLFEGVGYETPTPKETITYKPSGDWYKYTTITKTTPDIVTTSITKGVGRSKELFIISGRYEGHKMIVSEYKTLGETEIYPSIKQPYTSKVTITGAGQIKDYSNWFKDYIDTITGSTKTKLLSPTQTLIPRITNMKLELGLSETTTAKGVSTFSTSIIKPIPVSLTKQTPVPIILLKQPTIVETKTISKPIAKVVSEPITKLSVDPITKPLYKTVVKPVTRTITEPITKTITQPITKVLTEPVTKVITEPITKTITQPITKTITQPITKVITQPISKTLIQQITQPITSPPTRLFPTFKGELGPPQMTGEEGQGYGIKIKERYIYSGKKRKPETFTLVKHHPLSYQDAHRLAGTLVDQSSARSFKIVQVPGKPKPLKLDVDPWSILSMKFYKKGDTFIESTDYAIDTSGELRDITWRGIYANMKRQSRQPQRIKKQRQEYYDIPNIFDIQLDFDIGKIFGGDIFAF